MRRLIVLAAIVALSLVADAAGKPVQLRLKNGSRVVGYVVEKECSNDAVVLRDMRTRRKITIPWTKVRPDMARKLRIDLGQHRVWLDDSAIKLSAREFRLLARLASQEGRVVPLEDLVQETHGLRVDGPEAGSLLRPLVRSLRRKLGYPAGQMGCIENVRGVGYQLLEPLG